MAGENYVTTGAVEVPFSDDEAVRDDDLITDDEEGLKLTNPVERQARLDKRRARASERERERKEQEAELKELRDNSAKTARELAELKGFVAGQRGSQSNDSGGGDPYKSRLDAVYEKQNNAFAAYQAEIKAGTVDEKRTKYYEGIAREVEQEKTEILTERVIANRMPAQRQEQAQQVWVQKYPDVYNNPAAFKYASATAERRKALGEQLTNESVDEIMSETMTTFKLGPKRAPSASDRAKLSGIPSSGSGGGGERTGGIPKTKEFMKMAVALNPDMPEDKAFQVWVDSVGKELRKQKAI